MKCTRSWLRWVILFASVLFGSAASANSFSAFPEVVRIQGPSPTSGGSGSLIDSRQVGNLLGMVFLATDHTLRRVPPLTTIGFGNLGAPDSNISFASSIDPVVFSYGANGTSDMSLIAFTIDLSLLSSAEATYLAARTPIAYAAAPSISAPFEVTDYGFGRFGAQVTYGTQATFQNVIDSYFSFSGSYTDDVNDIPLVYTQQMMTFTYNDFPNGDWVIGEGAGYGGYSGSPLMVNPGGTPTIVGYQVNGSDLVDGSVSLAYRLTAADVAWIDGQASGYLATVPEPSSGALCALGIALLGLRRRRCGERRARWPS